MRTTLLLAASTVVIVLTGCGGGVDTEFDNAPVAGTAAAPGAQPVAVTIATTEAPAPTVGETPRQEAAPRYAAEVTMVADTNTGAPQSAAMSAQGKYTVSVSSGKSLQNALSRAVQGTEIIVEDGTYAGPFEVNARNGRSDAPIVIHAAHQGRANIAGNAGFVVGDSSNIIISGFRFTNRGTAVAISSSQGIRITRNTFALAKNSAPTRWIALDGTNVTDNIIDRNEFGPRRDLGQMISIDGDGKGQVAQRTLIEYNYFHDAHPQSSNGGETIRVGLSSLSMSNGHNVIQNNLFSNCDSDDEVVSVKSGHNIVRYNTFVTNRAQVTSRHGHGNSFYGNYFFGDGKKQDVGGFRIYGNDHKIYNNYMQNLTGPAIQLDYGDYDGGSSGYGTHPSEDQLARHWRIYRADIVNNTIVDSAIGVLIGNGHTRAPVDVNIANNIVVGTEGILYHETRPSDTKFMSNIGYGSKIDNVSRHDSEIRNIDPKLVARNGLMKLSVNSPAINTGVRTFSYITDDIDGQARVAMDIGADEYSSAQARRRPLGTADVGPNARH